MTFYFHLKKYILSGMLAIVPIVLVCFILRFFYLTVDNTILNLLDNFLGFKIPGSGILIAHTILYLLWFFTDFSLTDPKKNELGLY